MARRKIKKVNQRIIKFLIIIGLLISCCLLLFYLFNRTWKEVYNIESRSSNIEKEKKKDGDKYHTISWLRVQGTNIDTPVIGYEKSDDEIPVDKSNFLWNEINEEKLYNKVNILGHNVLNLSSQPVVGDPDFTKFEELMSFVYTDFAKENQYIQYTINSKDYLYKIFAVYFDKQYNLDLYHQGNYSKKEMKDYLKKVKKESIYDFDLEVTTEDKVLSLITCTRMFGYDTSEELVVVARMVHENEKIKKYEVKENKNYERIKEIMKGDDVNEEAQV